METISVTAFTRTWGAYIARLFFGIACLGLMPAQAVTITVKGSDGAAVLAYRYTIQEDSTFDVIPDVTGITGNQATDPTLALQFHRSHSKIVKVGRTTSGTVEFAPPDSSARYFVSVMPDNGSFGATTADSYTMSGVAIRAGAGSVVVPVNKLPFKTAQISVFVFEDNAPVNGAPDSPGDQEAALCGFEVQLFEAGGTYGASGGRVSTDTFGNPLGTEYPNPPVYDAQGALVPSKIGANQFWSDRNGVVRIKNLSPAKYTIYSIPPGKMPGVSRCNFADANGNATNVPIWVATDAQKTRSDQLVWDSQYEIKATNSASDQSKWHQTTTIEGTWGVDAWVKAGEPTFFKEFGPPGHHVWHGFIRRFKDTSPSGLLAAGGATVTGKVVSTHMSRPPGIRFYSGAPMASCWVAITEVTAGTGLGRTLYANACDNTKGQEGRFSVGGLKAGQRYQVAVWDEPLDNVIANYEFSVPADGSNVALNDVPVFSWFSNLQGKVFYDKENTGYLFDAANAEKPGIPGSILNIRFRDGSIYQSVVTDDEGKYEFPEFFPFFNWMIAETDFTRFKATGATIIADNGGAVKNPSDMNAPLGLWPQGLLAPQEQPENGNKPYRIFGGLDTLGQAVAPSSGNLLQAIQGFLGQTNVIHWGKSEYNRADPTDHGGITGIIHYAATRAEFDPKFAVAENNEPGIPSVEVRLYKLNAQNKVVSPSRGVIEPSAAGVQDAVQVVVSDSFDKAQPEDCVDPIPYSDKSGHSFSTGTGKSKCYDGMRIWNQVRDGVFDGGWAFVDYCPSGVVVNSLRTATGELITQPDNSIDVTCVGNAPPVALPPGRYMTEAVAPYGYEHQKEEDKNVDFGDLLSPGTLADPATCMGSRDEAKDGDGNPIAPFVPAQLGLFDGVEIPARFRDTFAADGITPLSRRPYCNKKLVVIAPGMNPFSDYHMFAKTAPAGHIVGLILDDLANEFDPYAPSFGEKYAPPFMPVSIRDYAGNEINRVYSDRYGTYNALVPSTFSYNVPLPSGVAPNMVNVCLNSPTMKDPTTGATVIDPHYNPQYTQYCYTFQYLPGKTTYLDTPVLPIAAFAGPSQYSLDTEQPDGTPGIKMVTANAAGSDVGPWVPASGGTIKIYSMGLTKVFNPSYDQSELGNLGAPGSAPKNIDRNFGFGTATGSVIIGGTTVPAANVTWGNDVIGVNVPANVSGTVEVLAANGRKSLRGVTLHAGTTNMPSGVPIPVGADRGFKTIQSAIDATSTRDGDLVMVDPGLYEEAPIVWKRVRVQGYGAPVTIVNAAVGAEYLRQQAWREKACDLLINKAMGTALLPGQTLPANLAACLTGDTVDNAPLVFGAEEASGFFVLQKPLLGRTNAGMAHGPFIPAAQAPVPALQIDGFTVTGADTGGGIVANGNAVQLQISNNRITGNQGLYNGGIRIGHADLANADLPVDANNLLVNIHHNEILKNGNTAGETAGGGGGISIYTGARGYRVADNYIAGNFSTGDGGGMVHLGASGSYAFNANAAVLGRIIGADNRTEAGVRVTYASTVSNNQFRFNQSFSQSKSVQGGGLAVMGIVDPVANNGITLGTGDMTVINNVFQGNLAGAGDGGGIALVGVNGAADVRNGNRANWNKVDILNNVIVNNGAGVAGGGISLQDSPGTNIVNNTVSLNDSYATAGRAFQGSASTTDASNCAQGTGKPGCLPNAQSVIQDGAGIVEYGHSGGLLARFAGLNANQRALAGKAVWFSDAQIVNSVVLGNRSYNWKIDYTTSQFTCAYNTANGAPCFSLIGPADGARAGNDIAVLFTTTAVKTPTVSFSVLSSQNAVTATGSSSNSVGDVTAPTVDFTSAYANGSNGVLKQLLYSLEQGIVIGAPVLEVQETSAVTVPSTAAAFDEGGNFIDVRFGPLTRGAIAGGQWVDFGTYNPTTTARGAGGSFANGSGIVVTTWPKLATDLNGVQRVSGNFVRGALAR
jgi:large repetitive protein